MTEKRDYPFLVGGAVLAVMIGLMEILSHTLGEWGIYAVFVAISGGAFVWLRQEPAQKRTAFQLPQTLDTGIIRRALAEAEKVITQLGTEVEDPKDPGLAAVKPQVNVFQSQVNQIATEMNRDDIRLVVMGAKGSGKTTLIQLMQSGWAEHSSKQLSFAEAASLFTAGDDGLSVETLAHQQAIAADIVLFLVTGDITQPEYQTLKRLAAIKRTLLVFNKQDQYLPQQRQIILNQLQRRGQGSLKAEADVVAIAAAPNPIKVRQHQSDSSTQEWLEEQKPNISALTGRLEQILQQESQQLVLASSFTRAMALGVQAKTVLNDVRRTRALPVVEQFQWVAAGTAFASPLPAMDLVATVAINAQMIHDLGAIYRQKVSLQQAQKIAATLGSVMLKLGLVELSTQAIAGLLKSNAITYLAGGCIQGISAAYLTRVAGLSLIEYFHSQEPNLTLSEASPLAIERLTQILQRVFQQNQQLAFLQLFVNQALDRVSAAFPQPQLAAATDPSFFTTSSSSGAFSPGAALITPESVPLATPQTPVSDHNGTDMRLTVSDLDPTTLPQA
jgi:uncharacterized protein (DUF697 family)/nucleotide-binding universal stress UspA family protein